MNGFFLGLIDLAIGLGFVFAGLRLFFAILPIGAFFVGGYAASVAVYHLFDDAGFLDTTLSIAVGLAVGVGLALVSYLFWYVGALILAGGVGAMIGSGIMAAFTTDADVLTFLVALAGAAIAVFLAYLFNLPTLVVIIVTSLIGAAIAVLGAMLVLNRVDVDELSDGPALAAVDHSWFWILVWAVLAAVGIYIQYVMSKEVEMPEGRWTRLNPETYAHVGRTSAS